VIVGTKVKLVLSGPRERARGWAQNFSSYRQGNSGGQYGKGY
jgi:hypothetical protein